MATYETSKVYPNEVVKADDFEFGFEAQIDNISKAFQGVFEPNQDFVIGGKVTPYYQGGMNVSIAPIFGVCASTEKSFIDTSKIEPISITQADSNDTRIDIIQVRAGIEYYDEQQRSFSNFETGVNELDYVTTKQRYKVESNVKIGTPGDVTAPTVDEGWVKLAEIVIPVGTTEITNDNIKNITADIAGLENSEWTNEKTATFNMGYISDVNRRFRQQHNEDGTHKARIIGENQLNIGISSGQVSGNVLPIGKQIPVNETSNAATTNISDIVSVLASKITDLFNSYLKYGAFNFKGELVIGNIIDDNAIVSPLKIGADGDGTAYLKIGNRNILTITVTGQIRMADGYTATASTDLVTKAVTDSLNTNLTNLTNRVDNIVANLDSTVYTNNLYSRYSVYTEQPIAVATTTAIVLSGLKTVDGIQVTQGQYVLVKNQTNEIENGIYLVSEENWTRDIFTTAESLKYKFFVPTSGTENKNKLFYIPQDDFTVDTNNIVFKKAIFDLGITNYTVPIRDSSGTFSVPDPAKELNAANKKYVDSKINDETTSSNTTWSSAKLIQEVNNLADVYVGSEEPSLETIKIWVEV